MKNEGNTCPYFQAFFCNRDGNFAFYSVFRNFKGKNVDCFAISIYGGVFICAGIRCNYKLYRKAPFAFIFYVPLRIDKVLRLIIN